MIWLSVDVATKGNQQISGKRQSRPRGGVPAPPVGVAPPTGRGVSAPPRRRGGTANVQTHIPQSQFGPLTVRMLRRFASRTILITGSTIPYLWWNILKSALSLKNFFKCSSIALVAVTGDRLSDIDSPCVSNPGSQTDERHLRNYCRIRSPTFGATWNHCCTAIALFVVLLLRDARRESSAR